MKTITQALLDEIFYPIPLGYVENRLIARDINGEDIVNKETMLSDAYKGVLADCLVSLVQATDLTEADKSIKALSEEDKKRLFIRANRLYAEIGEQEVESPQPKVFIESI